MKKILLLIDSAANLSEEEQNQLEVCTLPLALYDDNGNEYISNINDISPFELLKLGEEGRKFSTGCTPQLIIEQTINEKLKEYDYILALPISSKWSSQYSHLKSLSNQNEFKNRLYVAETYEWGFGTECLCKELRNLINSGCDNIDTLIKFAENYHNFTISFFACKSLDGLVQSGRIPKIIANVLKLTKIYPIIKVDKENKREAMIKSWNEVTNRFIKAIYNTFGNSFGENDIKEIAIVSVDNTPKYINEIKTELVKNFNIDINKIQVRTPANIFINIVKRYAIGVYVISNKKKIA